MQHRRRDGCPSQMIDAETRPASSFGRAKGDSGHQGEIVVGRSRSRSPALARVPLSLINSSNARRDRVAEVDIKSRACRCHRFDRPRATSSWRGCLPIASVAMTLPMDRDRPEPAPVRRARGITPLRRLGPGRASPWVRTSRSASLAAAVRSSSADGIARRCKDQSASGADHR